MTAQTAAVGHNIPRPGAYDKVTGGRGFPINVRLPRMLHGKSLRSPYAHARIRRIDVSAAVRLPGVKTETGQVAVLRVVYAHDIGRVIHPSGAEGQVEGGFQQGLGDALSEHLQFDRATGACVSPDFLDYKMPAAVEMPRRIESIFIESNEPTGPIGAKSLAEMCVIVPAPAIANAIYDACGARVRDLPITPEKILAALGRL